MAFAGPGLEFVYTGMVVTDSKLYDRGHMVRRWADGIARNFEVFVIEEAPLNKRYNTGHGSPGGLKAGLFTNVERVGPRHLLTTVHSLAPYTKYVAGGTADQIFPNAGRLFKIPINEGFMAPGRPTARDLARGATLHRVIRGQERNQFFERAYVRTAQRHPSLRPFLTNAFKVSPGL